MENARNVSRVISAPPRACLLPLLSLLLSSLAAPASSAPLPSVLELDGESLGALLRAERERDVLVVLHAGGAAGAAAVAAADDAARTLRLTAASSIVLATLDAAQHGFPAGLHVHHAPPFAVLFPALEREERVFEHWLLGEEDGEERVLVGGGGGSGGGAAETCSHGGGGHDHHDHNHYGHGHTHEPPLTAPALVRWLSAHTTFPSEVPAPPRPPLAARWRGREEELWRAVGGGLEALRAQMDALKAELNEAKAELARREACP